MKALLAVGLGVALFACSGDDDTFTD